MDIFLQRGDSVPLEYNAEWRLLFGKGVPPGAPMRGSSYLEHMYSKMEKKKDFYSYAEWECVKDRMNKGECPSCGMRDYHQDGCGTVNGDGIIYIVTKEISFH